MSPSNDNRKLPSRFVLVAFAFLFFLFLLNLYSSSFSSPTLPLLPYECQSDAKQILQAERYARIFKQIHADHLTFLSNCALRELMVKIISLECDPNTPANALMIETGVAAGGSAIAFTSVKRTARPFYLYDTFEGMPPPSERDGADVHRRYQQIQINKGKDDGYYGNINNLKKYVEDKFEQLGLPINSHSVRMNRGLFQDTIPKQDKTPVMFVNVDCDWYDSVYTVLDRLAERLIPGGIVYIDDYETYSGATNATNDFLAEKRNEGKWKFSQVNCPGGKPMLTRLSL